MTKLEERVKLYDIPEIPYLPAHEDVLIFRIPDQERTAGGLYMPDTSKEPKSYGVLMAAGCAAWDSLAEDLMEEGDIVWFGTYEGEEKEVAHEVGMPGKKMLQMKAGGVRGSVDAVARRKHYRLVRDPVDAKHRYEPREEEPKERKLKSVKGKG